MVRKATPKAAKGFARDVRSATRIGKKILKRRPIKIKKSKGRKK